MGSGGAVRYFFFFFLNGFGGVKLRLGQTNKDELRDIILAPEFFVK